MSKIGKTKSRLPDTCRDWHVKGPKNIVTCFRKLRCKKCTKYDPAKLPKRSRFHVGVVTHVGVQNWGYVSSSTNHFGAGLELGWHSETAKIRRHTKGKQDSYSLSSKRYFVGIKASYLRSLDGKFQGIRTLASFDYSFIRGRKIRVYGSGPASAPIIFAALMPKYGFTALMRMPLHLLVPSFDIGFTKIFGKHPLSEKGSDWHFNLRLRIAEFGLEIRRVRFGIDISYLYTKAGKESLHELQMLMGAKYVF